MEWARRRGTVNDGRVRLITWPLTRPGRQLSFDEALALDGSFSFVLPGEVLRWARGGRVLLQA